MGRTMTFKKGLIPWNKGITRKCPWMRERNRKVAMGPDWDNIKKKISLSSKGRPKPNGFGEKLSKARKGIKLAPYPKHWRDKKREMMTGDGNPNWVGGSSRYRGSGWERLRETVYERDNYTCQKCGKTNGKIHAHHIVPYRVSRDNSLTNLITLCVSCHTKRTHREVKEW